MQILYVISDDIQNNSSANIRNVSIINGLLKNGHSVQVACLHNSKKGDESLAAAIRGCKITYLNAPPAKQGAGSQSGGAGTGLLRRLKQRLKRLAVKGYNLIRIYDPYIRTVKKVNIDPRLFETPDVILSSSDPRSGHVLALRIKKLMGYGGPYVQYWGDPMTNDISASSLVKPFLRMAEKKLLHQADFIVYTNEAVRKFICGAYHISEDKTASIPTSNAINLEADCCGSPGAPSDVVSVGYFGGYYKKTRNMQPLLDAVMKNSKLKLTLAGNTDWEIPACDRIIAHKSLGADEVAQLQNNTDILIVMENLPKPGSKSACYQIPGKAYHYGLTAKKVLIITETGITKDEFQKYDRYAFCKNEPDAISQAVLALSKDQSPNLCHPLEAFYPQNVATALLQAISEVLPK